MMEVGVGPNTKKPLRGVLFEMIFETWMMDDTVDGLEILPQHATTMWLEVSPHFLL